MPDSHLAPEPPTPDSHPLPHPLPTSYRGSTLQPISHSSSLRSQLASVIPPPSHFLKDKNFYKPQQFIWNNPHRVSKKIYPYFHKSNDEYERKMKPLVRQLQDRDRKAAEEKRIEQLTRFRCEARERFSNHREERLSLQFKSQSSRKRYSSEHEHEEGSFTGRSSTKEAGVRSFNSFSNKQLLSHRLSIPDQVLLCSLNKYDLGRSKNSSKPMPPHTRGTRLLPASTVHSRAPFDFDKKLW